MEHSVRPISDGKEVVLTGRLTFADHNGFRSIIAMFQEPGSRRFVLDLSAVEFIDSAALGMVLLARDTAISKGISLILKGAKGQVRRIMEVAKFNKLFAMED
ncbi:MAG: STAS domain-containing protein [Rhodospirillales bacterium]|jgi:anti-anti-sigma factor|nr:STAS domain-containing protein [Rhodospirillales bacterium]MDK9721563.1 STAS domain-containing protein [Rhodospirillales bacterium]